MLSFHFRSLLLSFYSCLLTSHLFGNFGFGLLNSYKYSLWASNSVLPVFFIIFLCFTRRFTYLPLNPWLSNAYLSVKLSDKHTIYSGAAQCQFCIVFYIITWCWSSCGCDSQLLEIKEDIGTQLVFGFLLMTKADILKMD